jgi:apolipoprotein N-acyltransferase
VLGYTLLDTTYLKYLASLGGVYLLSLLVVLGNMLITDLAPLFAAHAGSFLKRIRFVLSTIIGKPRVYIGVWLFLCCFVFSVFFGLYREQYRGDAHATCMRPPLRVAVVSSTIPTDESIGEGAYRNYRAKIEDAFASGATLIILPENAFPFFELNESDNSLDEYNLVRLKGQDALYADFLELSRLHPTVSIAVGIHTSMEQMRYNSLVIFSDGKPVVYYHKRKLVPFAEYAPLGFSVPLVMPFNAGVREQYFSAAGFSATGLMCSEVSDTTIPLDAADMVISPSNDSVFASDAIALIHHRMARMRALEADAYLLRASKGGISGIIEPNGNVRAETRGDAVIVADICPEDK